MSKEINELITEMGQLFEGYAFTEEELNKLEALYKKLKVVMAKEFEYPFETGEHCWFISSDGSVFRDSWNTIPILSDRYSQGNVFKIKQEAERKRDKRALLTRFRQFRDKCNGDWEPGEDDEKHYINILSNKVFIVATDVSLSSYPTFGYFKTEFDCLHAIDLFGDEIKRLWVDE